MITKEQARALVASEILASSGNLREGDEWIVLDASTIEKPWGWVFFYTSRKWHETLDFEYAVAGNAPFIVERETGALVMTGTAMSIETYIDNYERTGKPHG